MESPSDQPQPHAPEVTVVLRPAGRGNWSTLTMVLTGDRAQPLLFRVGQVIDLAGFPFRICEVHA